MAQTSQTEKAEATLDELRQDMATLKADFSRLMETLTKTAQHGMQGAASEAEMAASGATDWAEEQYLTLRENIRAQPITACAIAAGMGLVFAHLLRR